MKINHSFLLLLLILPAALQAGNDQKGGRITKEKKISKSYAVSPTAGLDVTNKYGNVYVTTWNEDKIAIDVVIKASADKESLVDERINSIDVSFQATKSLVKANTQIGSFRGKAGMEINYTIRIPVNGSIILNNHYGSIRTGKINGNADIECKYGDVSVEELNNDYNRIAVEYCGNAKFGFIRNGAITAGYSALNLTRALKLTVDCEYSPLKIGDVDNLTFKCEYGNLSISNGDKITGTSEYTGIKIGQVNSLLNITAQYGDINIGNVTKNVKNVAINAEYTPISLKHAQDNAFDFEIITEYTRLDIGSPLKFQEKREKPTQAYYKGYHKNSGVNRLYIKSEYGRINLNTL